MLCETIRFGRNSKTSHLLRGAQLNWCDRRQSSPMRGQRPDSREIVIDRKDTSVMKIHEDAETFVPPWSSNAVQVFLCRLQQNLQPGAAKMAEWRGALTNDQQRSCSVTNEVSRIGFRIRTGSLTTAVSSSALLKVQPASLGNPSPDNSSLGIR